MSLNRRLHREEGLTLIELLVVIAILGIVGLISLRGIINGLRATDRVDQRVSAFTDLQRNTERITRELRGGVWSGAAPAPTGCVVLPLNPYDTQIVVLRSADRLLFTWTHASGTKTVVQDVKRWSTAASAWTAVSNATIADGILNRSLGIPVFRYLDENGVATTDPAKVKKIRVFLRSEVGTTTQTVEIDTTVSLRNGGLPCPRP